MQKEGGLGEFYWRRFLRLFPAMAVVCLALLTFGSLIFDANQIRKDLIYGALYVSNWTRMLEPGDPKYLGHFWSTAVEEQFYLIWPACFILLNKIRRPLAWTAVVAAFLASIGWRIYLISTGSSVTRVYNGLDTRADELLIGCTLAFLTSSQVIFEKFRRACLLAHPVAAAFIIGVTCFGSNGAPWLTSYGHTLVSLATAIIICAALGPDDTLLKRTLEWAPLVSTGKISYGLYLWHYPIAFGMLVILKMPVALAAPAGILFSFLAAKISFHLIEQPLLKYKHDIARPKAVYFGTISAIISILGMALGMSYYWKPEISYLLDDTPMTIEAYGPHHLGFAEKFNVQPDGNSAFWFRTSRFVPRDTKVLINEVEQPAPYIQDKGLVVVGPRILERGKLAIRLVDSTGRARSNSVYLEVE